MGKASVQTKAVPDSHPASAAASHTLVQAGLIALVGRPNVGKSALFNRLAGRRISIVHDEPGVTRDRITARCTKTVRPCTLMDTGGIGAHLDDAFSQQVRLEAQLALASAGCVLFVVDARDGLQPVDLELAKLLRKAQARVLVVVNKIDTEKQSDDASEFSRLGFADVLAVSAEHGLGIERLLQALNSYLEQADLPEPESGPDAVKIALCGRPNAGKSSLTNALLGDARTIVSAQAGTTRDSVDIPWRYGDQRYLLIDTAGIRRRSKMDEAVEVFSSMRAKRALERADIVALVVDCAAGANAQDRRIARMIQEANRPCLIVANKYDLFHPDAPRKERLAELTEQLQRELFFVDYAPILACSALSGKDTKRIHAKLDRIRASSKQTISTGELNRVLQRAFELNPPPLKNKRRLKLFYSTTIPDDRHPLVPLPRYLLFVNDAKLLSDHYRRYLEKALRSHSNHEGLPIRIIAKSRR